jgi:predicted TIM-barrel fold metal-dependent hydrolase
VNRRRLLGLAASCALGRSARAAPRIVDPHVHLWTTDPRYPFAREAKDPPTTEATPEMLLALMKAHGVAKTVIVQVSHYRWDNRYLAAALRRYPQHFTGVCRVDPQDPAAPDQLSRLVEEDHFQGLRLSPLPDPSGDWIRGPLMPPLWGRCLSLHIPLTIQTKSPRLTDLPRLIEKFPALDVVVDHMADIPPDQPAELAKLLALARYPRVFVKISHTWWISRQPYPYPDALDQVKRLYDRFGPQRLMWGTDWPVVERFCGYARALAVVREEMKFLTDEDQGWVLGKTVERVWRV